MPTVSATTSVSTVNPNELDWGDIGTAFFMLMGKFYNNLAGRLETMGKELQANINQADAVRKYAEEIRNGIQEDKKGAQVILSPEARAFFDQHPELIPSTMSYVPGEGVLTSKDNGAYATLQQNLSGVMDKYSDQHQMDMLSFQAVKNKLDQVVSQSTNVLQSDNETRQKVCSNLRG